jgi:hypothetical protein
MPDINPYVAARDRATRIDLAQRLDSALDGDETAAPGAASVLALPEADPVATFVSLATEIRQALHHPMLSAAERRRIHGRALDIAEARGQGGLRRTWPQLAHRGLHPAVIGGAAAAVLAVVGVAALQRRGHGGHSALQPA